MQITTSSAVLSAREGNLRTDDQSAWSSNGTESLWLAYTRLVGWPSVVCGAAAVLLHQTTCELASEPTHWGIASFIGGLCFVFVIALLTTHRRTGLAIMMAIVVMLVSAAGLLTWEHCPAHSYALYGLIGLSISLIASCLHGLRLTSLASAGRIQQFMPIEQAELASGEAIPEEADEGFDADSTSRLRPAWARYGVAIVLSAAAFIYLVAVPTVSMVHDMIWPSNAAHATTDMSLAQSIQLHVISAIVMLLFLAAGASIGSFLNVVIFRLPRRRPLFLPSSACPSCENEIAGLDNIPIVSWLRLGGRCRCCRVAISPRYPIIEATVGLLFVVFYFRELLSGGANLPIRPANMYNGIVWILLYTKWDLVTLYFYHMFVLVSLLAWGMINFDRFRVPIRTGLSTIVLILVLVSVFPHLNPIAAAYKTSAASKVTAPVPAGLVDGASGCISGLVAGLLMLAVSWRPVRGLSHADRRPDGFASPMLATGLHEVVTLQSVAEQTNASPDAETLDVQLASLELPEGPPSDTADEAPVNELYGDAAREPNDRANVALSLALVGAALGYESVLMVIALTAILVLSERLLLFTKASFSPEQPTAEQPLPAALWVFASATVLHVFWQGAYQLSGRISLAVTGGV